MGKKKQGDFQKTKLRVGRTLPKGKNITNTSFKSKKITVPEQKLEKPGFNLKDQLNLVQHSNPKARIDAFLRISNYIQENNSFIVYLPDILEKAERATLDAEAGVRDAAIKLLDVTLSQSPNLQIEGHIHSIVANLRCSMTHSDFQVRKHALKFLGIVLTNHPNLLSNYHSLLSVILDMISCNPISKCHGPRKRQKRNVPVLYGEHVVAHEWRTDVLKQFEIFLKVIIESYGAEKEDVENENTIYWTARDPLFVSIYAGGGLKPLAYDLSKDLKFLSNNVDSHLWTPVKLKSFIDEVTTVLMSIFAEEFSEYISQVSDPWLKFGNLGALHNSFENCCLPGVLSEYINTIAQIFCSLAKWTIILSKTEPKLEAWFLDKFISKCDTIMKGFPYCVKAKNPHMNDKTGELHVVRLNLALSFLCCGYSVEKNSGSKYRGTILKYMIKVINMRNEIRKDSIPMIIRIARAQLGSPHLEEDVANKFLEYLCESIKKPNHAPEPALIKFFTEIVTDIKFYSLVLPPTMEVFFKILLHEMSNMCTAKILNRELVENLKRICSLDHDLLLSCLQSVKQQTILNLFEFNDEESQQVAAYFLCHIEAFHTESLLEISEMILDSKLCLKSALYVIRTLAERFAAKAGDKNKRARVEYIKFLLNVAIDTFAIDDVKWEKNEDANFHENWPLVEDYCSYKIIPSAHWKRHSKIFEECKDSLLLFPKKEAAQCIINISRDILVHNARFPVHTVISLWRLINDFPLPDNRQFNSSFDSLLFSCMLYCGVFSRCCKNRENFIYGINELVDSMHLADRASNVIKQLETEIYRMENINAVEYFLRIIHFFMSRNFFLPEHQRKVLTILHNLQAAFGDDITVRPLWLAICECFERY